jgi:hypothetical protein
VATTVAPTQQQFLANLGVTERCLSEDLGEEPDCDLLVLAERHPIVRKFIELRSRAEKDQESQEGQETLRAIRGPAPVFTLHAGRLRGATVADTENKVIWLLAAGTHRSGDRDDAYERIVRLGERDRLFPTGEDYRRLFARRNAEIVPTMLARVSAALALARTQPGTTHTVVLPGAVMLSLYAAEGSKEDTEELWMAVDPRGLERAWLPLIQAALTAGDDQEPWQYTPKFPDRGPDRRELRFTCLHRAPG